MKVTVTRDNLSRLNIRGPAAAREVKLSPHRPGRAELEGGHTAAHQRRDGLRRRSRERSPLPRPGPSRAAADPGGREPPL